MACVIYNSLCGTDLCEFFYTYESQDIFFSPFVMKGLLGRFVSYKQMKKCPKGTRKFSIQKPIHRENTEFY